MNIQPGYNPEKKCVTLCVESNLLSRYFPNFSGMILGEPGIPRNTNVEQVDNTTAMISFPLDDKGMVTKLSENKMSIGINADSMDVFQRVINTFINCALKKELKTTEFVPLYGYSIDELHNDIQAAVKNKRKLCIIRDYSEYLAMSQGKNGTAYIFHQYMVEYGTPEYTEAAILLYNKDMESLRNTFESKLVLESWC